MALRIGFQQWISRWYMQQLAHEIVFDYVIIIYYVYCLHKSARIVIMYMPRNKYKYKIHLMFLIFLKYLIERNQYL